MNARDDNVPSVSPGWKKQVSQALVAGRQEPPVGSVLAAAVKQVLDARTEFDRALHEHGTGGRPRPSEIASDNRARANTIRRCIDVLAEETDRRYPAASAATATKPSGQELLSLARFKAAERQRSDEVVQYLEDVADSLETRRPRFSKKGDLFDRLLNFHATPAMLRKKFVAQLMLTWSRVHGVEVDGIRFGSSDHHVGFIGFLAAAVAPLIDENDREAVPVTTLRRHALELRRSARDFGQTYLEDVVQFVR